MNYKCLYSIYLGFEGIKKDGTFKYFLFKDRIIYNMNCLLKKKVFFFVGSDDTKENQKKKIILNNINKNHQKNHYKKQLIQTYILSKLKYKYTRYFLSKKKYIYFIYKKKYFNNIVKYIYIKEYINAENYSDNYTKNINIFIKYMAAEYYLFKLKFNISDKEFFISIFYRFYIFLLKDEIIRKYGIDISKDFDNYHSIYLFLKEKKYVSKFYTKIKKQILDEYNNLKIFINDKKVDINKLGKSLKQIYMYEAFPYLKDINVNKKTMKDINKIIKNLKNNEN